jgi:hypothetical protein
MLGARAPLAMMLGVLVLGGCHVRTAEPVGYVEVTSAPADIYTYPSVVYQGRPTYWVQGRWVYRDPGGRWMHYRREPPELYRQRPHLQQAPPAYPQQAPPPSHYPPPAVRVQ